MVGMNESNRMESDESSRMNSQSGISLSSDMIASQDEGFVNHPHAAEETMNGTVKTEESPNMIGDIWSRSLEMARPYVGPYVGAVRTQVTANPWVGVGVAAGLFLTVGYLLGRRTGSVKAVTGANDFYSPNYSPNFANRSSQDYYGSTETGASNTVGARDQI